ncbi:MAG: hypothetical protein ABEI06_08970 [Halobacteriaceae archaeon]
MNMTMNPRILKAYLNHFMPRDVVGPVIIVFSLEGVIDGLFTSYVPSEYETLGWAIIFLISIVIVAYWGTVDEQAVEDLQDRIDEIQEQEETTTESAP